MPFLDPTLSLSTRQEAFCRHYTASGNAADAARRTGYAQRSARQTGCALLERPWIVERVRRIRLSWRRTERDEAQIVLARQARSSHQCHGLRGAVGPAGKERRAARCGASGKRLDAPCRPDSAALRVAPRRPPAASRASTVVPLRSSPHSLRSERLDSDAGRDIGENSGLKQAWDAAVASGSAYMMLRVLRFQAEMAGLTQPANRAALWPLPGEDEFGEIGAGEAHEAGTGPGPLADAVRRGQARAERALARHCESREAMARHEGFDEAAHARTAERLAAAVEERERLPVSFAPPPEPANDLPPADDPPEETYEDCPWAGGDGGDEDRTDDDRAEGAETDWLYQRRNNYADLHDPWSPENIEQRRQDSLDRLQRAGPFNAPEPRQPDGPDSGDFAPDHDTS